MKINIKASGADALKENQETRKARIASEYANGIRSKVFSSKKEYKRNKRFEVD